MATNETIKLKVLSNKKSLPLDTDSGSPYYVGARAYVTQDVDGATITVIDKEGTTTATVYNGEKGDTGATGQNGQDGQDGADGQDGFSPIATVSKVGDTATISITDANGTTTATVSDGADGQDGSVVSIDRKTTSGTNIADITIDGVTTQLYAPNGGGASAFVAEFNVTTYADVKDAYDDDAIIICTADDSGNTMVLQLVYFDATNEIFFFAEPNGDGMYWTELSNANGWDDGTRYLASTDVATQLADGLMSALDKQKLDGLSKRNIWYGTCSTSASSSPKSITTASNDFSLTAGNMLVVLFSHTNSLSSVSLQVDGGVSKSAYSMDGTSDISNRWGSNEVVSFVYDGTKFVMLEQGLASTTQYGITKLNNTVTSTSTSEAATANAVKTAYDNGGVQSVNGSTGAVSLSIHNVPSGGTSGQVLSKASGTDYDLAWSTVPQEVYWATEGTTTSAEIEAAYSNGKLVCVKSLQHIYLLNHRVSATKHTFINITDNYKTTKTCDNDSWTGATVSIDSDIYWATYGTTTSADIEAAYVAGKTVCVKKDGIVYTLVYRGAATNHMFCVPTADGIRKLTCNSDSWTNGATYFAPLDSNEKIDDYYLPDYHDVFFAEYGTTTSSDIFTALFDGKYVQVVYGNRIYSVSQVHDSAYFDFTCVKDGIEYQVSCNNSVWSASQTAFAPLNSSGKIDATYLPVYNGGVS